MAGFRSELAEQECTGTLASMDTCALYEARAGAGLNFY